MTRDEFIKKYNNMVDRAVKFSEIACKEGLLALEDELPEVEKAKKNISKSWFYSTLQNLQDKIQQNLTKKGIDLREIDTDDLPKFLQIIFDLKWSIMQKKLLKYLIKDKNDFFGYGIYLVVLGLNPETVRRKLRNKIKHEKDRYMSILQEFISDAVFCILIGTNPKVLSDALHGALIYILLVHIY